MGYIGEGYKKDWAELWLVKTTKVYCLGQTPAAEKNVDASRFWVIFQNCQNCTQIVGMSRRSIFHAPKSPQMTYMAKIKNIDNLNDKIQKFLELRLDIVMSLICALSAP